MSLAHQALLVFSNAPNAEIAEQLARTLVEQQLAACVSIMPAMRSIYRWEETVVEATEVALQIKTVASHYPQLEAAIKAAHPHAVPEIIAIPIVDGLPEYLAWIRQETNKESNA